MSSTQGRRRVPRRRSTPLVAAAILLIMIGLSGLLVGGELLLVRFGPEGVGGPGADEPAAVAIPLAIAIYAASALIAGCGLLLRRRFAHRLGVVVLLVGLAELVWQTTLLGLEPVTLFGVAVWAFALLLLLWPGVRSEAASW